MGFKETLVHHARKFGRTLAKKAPTIMVVGGTAGLVVSAVLACKETATKLEGILDEHREKVQALKDIRDGVVVLDEYTTEEYAEKHYKKHLTNVYLQTICKLAKAYAPALILALLSVTSILTGHNILNKRHLAAVAECYAVQNTLTEYRKRVKDKLGDEAERLLYAGGEKAFITDEETDEQTGEVKTSSHEGIVGDCEKLPHYTYIVNPETVCSYAYSNSDANFQRLLQAKIRDANTYMNTYDQVVLGDIMRHFWKDEYLRQHPEIFSHGWWKDNPLVDEPLPEIYPIDVTVKMISKPGERREYAVTFERVQGNITMAMDVVKQQQKDDARREKKLRRNIRATIKEATA